ncbi:MAG: DNA topoisomerase 4 subunit A [Aeromicrobium sp.]|uniref:DNA gyrase/topoisomerase IV subunit A n=1 Tax=Aeromicrobium sp. TaxID=1871063 RepID=UPI0039E4C3C2
MARSGTRSPAVDDFDEHIVDTDIREEMRSSFLEYSYSVIYSRALPDARDGLKPVQRRILYMMDDMGLRHDRGHVKSARPVGDVMGRLHPHGDGAIYDALVRLVQPWSLRLPLLDGHGNFGSPDDPPAAMRYTECRMDASAEAMTASIDEDTVDFRPNYDGRETEPVVLPAALPNLLVNGASGIAVGMATNIAPHNLGEVVAACRHLIDHPDATLEELMRFIPGPDLPTGGKIIGLDGVRSAYASGNGSFKMRATARIEQIGRRKGVVITELPYNVGPEKVLESIKKLVQSKKLQGIADLKNLTDRHSGLEIVVELKNGFVPEAVLEQLYKLTPLETSFGINAVALVDGQPRTLGLREMLTVYLDHRYEVVRRRTSFRRGKAADRLHVLEGLLLALVDIDEVIALIRSSENRADARERLRQVFELSEQQAEYILNLTLGRLTKYDRIAVETEISELRELIAELDAILADDALLRRVVGDELAATAAEFGTPRRTVLLESAGQTVTAATPVEVPDEPCWALLSSTGLLARTADDAPLPAPADRAAHDVVISVVRTSTRGQVGLVGADGIVRRIDVVDLPALPSTASAPSLQGGVPITELIDLPTRPVTLMTFGEDQPGLALGTRQGVVKRVKPDERKGHDAWEVIALADGDEVVGGADLVTGAEQLVFITSDAQLLRYSAELVRPQGRGGGGVAGVKLAEGARVIAFGVATDPDSAQVATVAGPADALPGMTSGSAKVTPLSAFPAKGRATGGVRCQRLLKGEDALVLAWAGDGAAMAGAANGAPVELPAVDERRDGSGTPLRAPAFAIAGPAARAGDVRD